ncbi:MAG: ABC transporter substrate-binding protein, partial [Candidatus Thermofonsia Clade 3 bacterium]
GNIAGEILAEFRSHADPLVKRIADSYAEFRNRSQAYMMQSYAGNYNARALPIRWG